MGYRERSGEVAFDQFDRYFCRLKFRHMDRVTKFGEFVPLEFIQRDKVSGEMPAPPAATSR